MTARTQPSRLWVGLILIIAPAVALAQAPGEGLLDQLITLMTDSYARLVAILAIIAVGFLWLFGRIDARWVVGILGGLILIFGAATFADLFISGVA